MQGTLDCVYSLWYNAPFWKANTKEDIWSCQYWQYMENNNNMETDKLMEGAYIVRFIKAQRIKWLGHIQRMDQARPTR